MYRTLILVLSVGGFGACSSNVEVAQTPELSIDEAMVTIVTPATNALWGVGDPQSDAEWQALAAAADATREVAEQMKRGGLLSDGRQVGEQEDWLKWSDEMLEAAQLAREAIDKRDVEGLLDAGNVLYPPCEACHRAYLPAVQPPTQ